MTQDYIIIKAITLAHLTTWFSNYTITSGSIYKVNCTLTHLATYNTRRTHRFCNYDWTSSCTQRKATCLRNLMYVCLSIYSMWISIRRSIGVGGFVYEWCHYLSICLSVCLFIEYLLCVQTDERVARWCSVRKDEQIGVKKKVNLVSQIIYPFR